MPSTSHELTARPEVDLLDPNAYHDLDAMHAAFTWMRAHEPVYRDQANGLWAVTRHADLLDVERRAGVFVSGRGYRSFESPGEDNMIALDGPAHAEQRSLVSRRFTPKAVTGHAGYLRETVATLLDAVADRGRMEVVDAIAAQLPCRLTAHLLGFPEERWADVKSWSERLMRYDAVPHDATVGMDFVSAIIEFHSILEGVAGARRAEPADDLVSVWANAELHGCPMRHETIVNETGLVISGGAETTRTVIARR